MLRWLRVAGILLCALAAGVVATPVVAVEIPQHVVLCNSTSERIDVASGWLSHEAAADSRGVYPKIAVVQGWFRIAPHECASERFNAAPDDDPYFHAVTSRTHRVWHGLQRRADSKTQYCSRYPQDFNVSGLQAYPYPKCGAGFVPLAYNLPDPGSFSQSDGMTEKITFDDEHFRNRAASIAISITNNTYKQIRSLTLSIDRFGTRELLSRALAYGDVTNAVVPSLTAKNCPGYAKVKLADGSVFKSSRIDVCENPFLDVGFSNVYDYESFANATPRPTPTPISADSAFDTSAYTTMNQLLDACTNDDVPCLHYVRARIEDEADRFCVPADRDMASVAVLHWLRENRYARTSSGGTFGEANKLRATRSAMGNLWGDKYEGARC